MLAKPELQSLDSWGWALLSVSVEVLSPYSARISNGMPPPTPGPGFPWEAAAASDFHFYLDSELFCAPDKHPFGQLSTHSLT